MVLYDCPIPPATQHQHPVEPELFPFDHLWVRSIRSRSIRGPRQITSNPVSSPYLDTQINTAMLGLAVVLLCAAMLRRNANADRTSPRFRLAIGCPGAILFVTALAFSVDPDLALHVPPPLSNMQFAFRLVTYCNLGIMVLLASVAAGGGFPKWLVSIACFAVLTWSFAAVCVKNTHMRR